MYKWDVNKE